MLSWWHEWRRKRDAQKRWLDMTDQEQYEYLERVREACANIMRALRAGAA